MQNVYWHWMEIKDFKGSLDINNSIKKNVILLWLVFIGFQEKGNIFKNKPKFQKKRQLKLSIDYLKC